MMFKAHGQCVSGVAWEEEEEGGGGGGRKVYTSSWDHSIKVWDVERQDCLQTLNGSKVYVNHLPTHPAHSLCLFPLHPTHPPTHLLPIPSTQPTQARTHSSSFKQPLSPPPNPPTHPPTQYQNPNRSSPASPSLPPTHPTPSLPRGIPTGGSACGTCEKEKVRSPTHLLLPPTHLLLPPTYSFSLILSSLFPFTLYRRRGGG